MFAATISNRPDQCRNALAEYADNEDMPADEWLVVCPASRKSEMKKAAAPTGATVVVETEFLGELPASARKPFLPSFGGWRNMALATAAKNRKDIVFLDDDTRPCNDVLRRHKDGLKDAGMVIGKYRGHVGGASSALLDLTHQLEKFNEGRLKLGAFEKVLKLRLSRIPPMMPAVENAGAVGGNQGISWKLARRQAFFPIPYRVEDGTYAALCPQCANPTVERSPIVDHQKEPVKNGLCDELAGDWKGNALASFVVARQKGQSPDVSALVGALRKGLLIDYFSEKYAKSQFRHPQLDRIQDLALEVQEAEADAAWALYRDVQESWAQSWESVG